MPGGHILLLGHQLVQVGALLTFTLALCRLVLEMLGRKHRVGGFALEHCFLLCSCFVDLVDLGLELVAAVRKGFVCGDRDLFLVYDGLADLLKPLQRFGFQMLSCFESEEGLKLGGHWLEAEL